MDEVIYNTDLMKLNLLYLKYNECIVPVRTNSLNKSIQNSSKNSPNNTPNSSINNSPNSSFNNLSSNSPNSSINNSPNNSPVSTPTYSPPNTPVSKTEYNRKPSLDRMNSSFDRDEELSFLKNMRNFNRSIVVNRK